QALITALSHLLRYSLMSNDEQVPLAREVRIVDEYYSIYHVRFGARIRMEWRISDTLDLTETMVPSFILQPIVENAFKHGISPKEEGGRVLIRIHPLREKKLLYISICDNGVGIPPEKLAQLCAALKGLRQSRASVERYEHIGVYNVAARLCLLDPRADLHIHSRPGRGTAVVMYLPFEESTEEECEDDPAADRG
ncbi:MAG: sensor histidine kinase, partial [Faecalibacterium sp.]